VVGPPGGRSHRQSTPRAGRGGDLIELMETSTTVAPGASHVAHFAQAFFLKIDIADGQDFITSRISGSRCAATAKPGRTYMPEEYASREYR